METWSNWQLLSILTFAICGVLGGNQWRSGKLLNRVFPHCVPQCELLKVWLFQSVDCQIQLTWIEKKSPGPKYCLPGSIISRITIRSISLKRCHYNDPNLNKCLLQFTQKAVPIIGKGLREIGLKSLDPLENVAFNVSGDVGLVNGAGFITKAKISGLSNVQIRNVTFNKKKSSLTIESLFKHIHIAGQYVTDSVLGYIPVTSRGNMTWDWQGLESRSVIKLFKTTKMISHGRVFFVAKKLANWTSTMTDANLPKASTFFISSAVDSNLGTLFPTVALSISTSFSKLFSDALRPMTEKFTVDDFFL